MQELVLLLDEFFVQSGVYYDIMGLMRSVMNVQVGMGLGNHTSSKIMV